MQEAFKDIAERSQKLLQDFAERYKADGAQPTDPLGLTHTFMDFTAKMLADPNRLVQAQMELWQQYLNLWQLTAKRMMGERSSQWPSPPRATSASTTRPGRTRWSSTTQAVLPAHLPLAAGTVKEVEGVDAKTAQKVDFYTRQFVDAMAPSNFVHDQPGGR